ncbi:hypothetical protein [Rhizobium leguminosarum]|uniref:hypothetical protein n=1 Tax=Rhizobium TaxID=379 RepID=UPI00103024DA|nr:hypothetical protein [Rhizobium leguminosarum]MBY5387381.1 hypothetical protein [Rhizobium leguminosarum]MBY5431414.1 hypothetical protein [Rhizobium leguminosarum]NEK41084.1 hypothetical protein [Rhizobium leguminosarum]TBF36900.1 hypothetical protein ELG88_17565 [Rhizobium leguminosarum]TBH55308.1 hypothetical protein ELG62_17860 [Rhizobium leguminosarum]
MRNRAASLPGGNVSEAAYPPLETIRETDFEQLLNKAPAAGNEPGFPNLQLTRSAEAAHTGRPFQRVISPRLKQNGSVRLTTARLRATTRITPKIEADFRGYRGFEVMERSRRALSDASY